MVGPSGVQSVGDFVLLSGGPGIIRKFHPSND